MAGWPQTGFRLPAGWPPGKATAAWAGPAAGFTATETGRQRRPSAAGRRGFWAGATAGFGGGGRRAAEPNGGKAAGFGGGGGGRHGLRRRAARGWEGAILQRGRGGRPPSPTSNPGRQRRPGAGGGPKTAGGHQRLGPTGGGRLFNLNGKHHPLPMTTPGPEQTPSAGRQRGLGQSLGGKSAGGRRRPVTRFGLSKRPSPTWGRSETSGRPQWQRPRASLTKRPLRQTAGKRPWAEHRQQTNKQAGNSTRFSGRPTTCDAEAAGPCPSWGSAATTNGRFAERLGGLAQQTAAPDNRPIGAC